MSDLELDPWRPVHAWLAEQALQRPQQRFLLAGEGLSYAQAEARVQALAAVLRDQRGQRVALWLDKGNAYALGVLAALQAGCTYVPIDGAQPATRAALILADAAPTVLICDHSHACALLAQGLPAGIERLLVAGDVAPQDLPAGVTLTLLGSALERLAPASAEAEPAAATAAPCQREDIAAILYTSGSTVSPKGVQLSHLNLSNFIDWSVRELGLDASDRLLKLASFNFDLSTFDLFATLQAGASLYVSAEHEIAQAHGVAELLRLQAITTLYTVPSMYALLNRVQAWQALPPTQLRRLIFAGEVMPKPQLQTLARALGSGCVLYNFYGPTETNVCLYHRVSSEELAHDGPVPIGTAIDGATVWLVDEQGRLASGEGAFGEIWVAGRCVTPGYWKRQDAANGSNHLRAMHATGDYGEWLDGRLIYRGRKDRMLKINGYRVELGEIEAVLARHPYIAEAAVLASGEAPQRLLAHVVMRDPAHSMGALELKAYCATQLPRYMLPHQVQLHSALPKNANGKTDYRALRDGQVTA